MASSTRAQLYLAICVYILVGQTQLSNAATEYNRYLAHLFQKYGTGDTMTFEGLEHLMYNLGLGQIEFEHTVDEHRPKGAKILESENDQRLNAFLEQQSSKLSQASKDADILTEHDAVPKNPDILDILIRENQKGILLEFKEMHDPKHKHPRETDALSDVPPLSAKVCLSPKSILRLVVDHDDLHKGKFYKTFTSDGVAEAHNSEAEYNEFINHVQLKPAEFMKLCPALLAQIDQQVCAKPAPLTNDNDPKHALWKAWIYASVSLFILSACGLLGILLVPLMKSVAYQEILKFLVAVAVGTLAGDALMHLLPHALVPEHDAHESNAVAVGADEREHEAVWICACAFFTCILMYVLEHILPLLKGDNAGGHGHSHAHGGHSHAHGHTHAPHTEHAASDKTAKNAIGGAPIVAPVNSEAREINIMLNETKKDRKSPSRPLTPLAFMVVIGDGLHNLTDGLAIGAAFASDPVTGMATAFAVLCHELPHELGDFALLLQTGVSMRRAVYLNIVSSVLSFVGMAVGLFLAGAHEHMTQWIYAATAGSFLYIALADLVPAMSEVADAHARNAKSKLKGTLIQITGMLLGGFIMLAIAVNEEALAELFK